MRPSKLIFPVLLLAVSIQMFALDEGVPGKNDQEVKTVFQDLCWSPDGNYIYFSAMQVKPDYSNFSPDLWTVYRYDFDKNETTAIISSALNVAVSPSGDRLAVARNIDSKRNLYTYQADGTNPFPLVTGEYKSSAPTWSPDGKRIAFMSNQTGQEEIWIVNVDTHETAQLTNSYGYKAYNPAWSPDDKYITYYLEKGDGMDQIHIIDSNGKSDRNITNDQFNNIYPGWIDSKTIIYGQGSKDGPTRLFSIGIDEKQKMQVGEIESFYGRYSPDRSKIAFVNTDDGSINIMTDSGQLINKIELSN